MVDAREGRGDAIVERGEAGGVGERRAASDAAAVAAKTRSAKVEKDGDRAGGMQVAVVRGGVCRASRAYVHEPIPHGGRCPSQ